MHLDSNHIQDKQFFMLSEAINLKRIKELSDYDESLLK